MSQRDELGNILPESGTDADRAHFLANVQGIAFCYLLGGARVTDFRFVDSTNLGLLSKEINDFWENTLWHATYEAPYLSRASQTGEQMFLVSMSFPCWRLAQYQYRTSGQAISVNDVTGIMSEMMDVRPMAREHSGPDGHRYFKFAWMFLASDLVRLLSMFPGVPYSPGWHLPMHETFHAMDRKLNLLAQRALDDYPFMSCEFSGW